MASTANVILNNIIKPILPYMIPPHIKTDLIDPLSIIVKLAILSYKPVGTKISIGNNRIWIQSPTILQGPVRTIYGDKKTDLNILQTPLWFACNYYLSTCTDRKYKWLFEKAIKGLMVLRLTYDADEIVYTISRLIQLIEPFVENENQPQVLIGKTSDIEMKHAIFKNLNSVWDSEAQRILTLFFSKIDGCGEMTAKKLYYINALEIYLSGVDEDFIVMYNYIFKK